MRLVQASNDPEGILTRQTRAVDPTDKTLVTEITAKLRAGVTLNQGLVGLAANQIGIDASVCICMIGHESGKLEWVYMINPEILSTSEDRVTDVEGCGSIMEPERILYSVTRPREIRLSYHDTKGTLVVVDLSDYSARVVQHEVDHLNGVLISDHGTPVQS